MDRGTGEGSDATRDQQVMTMRDSGASWADIERRFALNRQQARYAYQRAKREVRREERRAGRGARE